jgi:hypothetical protein
MISFGDVNLDRPRFQVFSLKSLLKNRADSLLLSLVSSVQTRRIQQDLFVHTDQRKNQLSLTKHSVAYSKALNFYVEGGSSQVNF